MKNWSIKIQEILRDFKGHSESKIRFKKEYFTYVVCTYKGASRRQEEVSSLNKKIQEEIVIYNATINEKNEELKKGET